MFEMEGAPDVFWLKMHILRMKKSKPMLPDTSSLNSWVSESNTVGEMCPVLNFALSV